MAVKRIVNPALFICDIQENFRPVIHEYPKVIATAQKMVRASKILNIPIYSTTQNKARLGHTVAELKELLPADGPTEVDKSAFSMLVSELLHQLSAQQIRSAVDSANAPPQPLTVLLVGIETHICVTQTTLDLLAMGHKVYILADGVSSCNAGERIVALERLRKEGAIITTSESVLFELLGDARDTKFKEISGIVKETKEATRAAVEALCRL